MKRRDFIEKTTLACAALPLAVPHWSFDTIAKYKLGLQLYSVRDAMAKNPLETLKQLKAMGYQDFEIYGFNPNSKQIYGYTVEQFKTVLDDLGLSVSSGHYGFSDYFDASATKREWFVNQCIEAAKVLGSSYITWPWVAPKHRNRNDFIRLAQQLNAIGKQVSKANLGFAYHNHGYEFENWNGKTGHAILMEHTDPALVKLQMDMYWVVRSGKTPKELVAQQPGRYVMWHIKDMDRITQDYTEMGKGAIDYPSLLPNTDISGLDYYYVEQGGNFAKNSMESAAVSAAYVKAKLLSYL